MKVLDLLVNAWIILATNYHTSGSMTNDLLLEVFYESDCSLYAILLFFWAKKVLEDLRSN